MTYRVEISPSAGKIVTGLDKPVRRRVMAAIEGLANEPRPPGAIPLRGQPGWRIRIGKVRVIYEIHDAILLVVVVDAGYRREVYE